MSTQDEIEKTVSRKKARKKRGQIFLLLAAISLVIYILLPDPAAQATQQAAVTMGMIASLAALCMLVFLIVGIILFIAGSVGKQQ